MAAFACADRDKWGPWLWGTLRWPGYGAPWETAPVLCPRCGQRHGLTVQECLLSCPSESRFWEILTEAWGTWNNQVATNGVHRRIAHVHPLAVPKLPSTILPSSPAALEGGSCPMSCFTPKRKPGRGGTHPASHHTKVPLLGTPAMGTITKWAIRLQTSDFYGPSPSTPRSPPPPPLDVGPLPR